MCYDWMRCMRLRKQFVQSHPKKLEIAEKIIAARSDKKGITFSSTIADAEKFKSGYVLHSKQSKKKNEEVLAKFKEVKTGFLHSSKAADCGVDIPGLQIGIILSVDSSKIRKVQRVGRIIRAEPGKKAELFTLVIAGTQEFGWWRNSKSSVNYTIINDKQLDDVLAGKEIISRQIDDNPNVNFRF